MTTTAVESPSSASSRLPRVLFVGGMAYELPLSDSLARKWDSLSERMDVRVIARARSRSESDHRFRLIEPRGTGGVFHLQLPRAIAREVASFQPDVVIAQSPYDALPFLAARPLMRHVPRLIVEVHGDWRTATRMYGSRLRRTYAGLADRAAKAALRRADATRSLSPFTASLAEEATGRPPLAVFPTYTDLGAFLAEPPQPLPETPTAVWIGVLQRYKAPDVLAEAWRSVARSVPDARLVVIGDGPLHGIITGLRDEYGDRVEWIPALEPLEVARALDRATALALPSRLEGMGRVAIEALARARPVVGTTSGGIRDIVTDGQTGLLVPPDDSTAFADALGRVLADRALAERLSGNARAEAQRFVFSADRYADAVRDLVDRTVAADR